MSTDERTYSMSEIREQRRVTSQRLALEQRRLDALAKMDEAASELEQAERELDALRRGETQAEQPAEAVSPEPEPRTIGERSAKILKDHAGTWLEPRDILTEMNEHGWVDTDSGKAIQRLRHSLRRLAQSNPQVDRDESGMTYRYKWRSDMDGYAATAVSHANGAPYPALERGQNRD